MNDQFNLDIIERKLDDIFSRANHYRLKDKDLVRIPDIPGRIFMNADETGRTAVELIYQRWYDPAEKQSRNRKTAIGYVFDPYPSAMEPTEKYAEFFDLKTGELLHPFEDPKPRLKKEKPAKPAESRKKKEIREQELPERIPSETKGNSTDRPGIEPDSALEHNPVDAEEEEDDNVVREIIENIGRLRAERERKELERAEREEEEQRLSSLYGEAEKGEVLAEQARERLNNLFMKMTDPEEMKSQQADEEKEQEDPAAPEDQEELEKAYAEYNRSRERTAILRKIMQANLSSIRNHAKRRPDDIVNSFKVQKINAILAEIRSKYTESGYADLLELIEEPQEEQRDGIRYTKGMTYSDVEILLDHYDTILEFIKADKKPEM